MKIALSILGRFHFFNLAEQLEKRGNLSQLITSYPKFVVTRFGIPREKISSRPMKEVLQRTWGVLPSFLKELYNPQYFFHNVFDRDSCHALRTADILVAGPSVYRYTMREAKRRGMTVIVENGSSHSRYATQIICEEYDRFGIAPPPILVSDPRAIEDDLRAYEEMDYISVPSLFAKRSFLNEGVPERKLIHVPYGIDLKEFYPKPKKDNVFRVIYVGAMTLSKGVHYLLRAFAELNLSNSELLLVGSSRSGDIEPFFKKYEGKFHWIGHVPQRELQHHYSQSSVFAICSIQEGLAMVQLQAMACGLPIIATTNTGAEDVVREGVDGFIIPIRDVEALKSKILFFYENPEACTRMGEAARERVSSGFTWDDYGDRIVAEYRRVLGK
ncbi:MAG: glycosyltransferase family 4 protein [Candidatus Brennerbacteria bacterium]